MERFFLFLVLLGGVAAGGLRVEYQWKFLDWVYPTVYLAGKNFTLGNSFPQDVDVDARGRIFVTSPQWLEGVPVTLSLITTAEGPGGPLLLPYPDWTWHTPDSCDSLLSVYRMAIDECNRLWIVDTGRKGREPICPTKILIFDLNTDQLIHKYVVPADQALSGQAAYVTPIVDVGDSCLDAYLYVADVDQNGLLIYNLVQDISWRLNNTRGNAFGPDDDAMYITIAGESFDLTDGTLGMSLTPKGFFRDRYLYFNSLASYRQKFVSTHSLKIYEPIYEPTIFESNEKRLSQAGVQATSRRGVIFFQLVQLTAVACWNVQRPFTRENVVILAQDELRLQYVSGIKVITNKLGEEELWLNTNRLQKTINMTLRPNETNFRVIRGNVDELIRGTRCEPIGPPREAPDTSSWHKI